MHHIPHEAAAPTLNPCDASAECTPDDAAGAWASSARAASLRAPVADRFIVIWWCMRRVYDQSWIKVCPDFSATQGRRARGVCSGVQRNQQGDTAPKMITSVATRSYENTRLLPLLVVIVCGERGLISLARSSPSTARL